MPKGSMSRSGTKKLKTTKNPDGSQQYVRGKTPMARVMTASDASNVAANMGERLFREKKIASSNKAYKASDMLYAAQVAEAKKEMARRKGKDFAGRKTLKK
jgi:hypothetical protein